MGANIGPGKLEMKVFRNDMHKLQHLDKFIKDQLIEILPRIGAKLEATIVGHIQSQDLGWTELSKSWSDWKAKKGYSKNTWIMTSSLMNSITFTVNKDELSVFVGVHRTAGAHPVAKAQLYEIAFALEFGTLDVGGRIPPRPLFVPSLEQSKRSVETSVGIAIRKAIKTFEAGSISL